METADDVKIKQVAKEKGSDIDDDACKRDDAASTDTTCATSMVPDNTTTSDPTDITSALIWNDGIGVLPGTDMKFRLTDSGEVEMVFDQNDDDIDDHVMHQVSPPVTSNFQNAEPKQTVVPCQHTNAQPSKTNNISGSSLEAIKEGIASSSLIQGNGILENGNDSKLLKADSSKVSVCSYCGKTGSPAKFWGRFCSKKCVGRNASRYRVKGAKAALHAAMGNRKVSLHARSKKDETYPNRSRMTSSVQRLSSSRSEVAPKRKSSVSKNSLKPRQSFCWNKYLESENAIAAPVEVFRKLATASPVPASGNRFKTGWVLEAVDPSNQSIFSLVSVVHVRGHRLKLHFEGYPSAYDFWTYCDSPFIFPCGFCAQTGRKLSLPDECEAEKFDLDLYIQEHLLTAAPSDVFAHRCYENMSGFEIDSKLEAVDKKHPDLTCVATVADAIGKHVLIHFDGWHHSFDYWALNSTNYIQPVGWCAKNDRVLSLPNGIKEESHFSWEAYLKSTDATAASPELFSHEKHGFEVGMKLEVVDPRNPILIRVASIAAVDDYRVKVHFDSWEDVYDVWMDSDSPDLHPVGYSAKVNEDLCAPSQYVLDENDSTCPISNCFGHGHVRNDKFSSHYSAFGCPYSSQNMNRDSLPNRLSYEKETSEKDDLIDIEESSDFYVDEDFELDQTRSKKRRKSSLMQRNFSNNQSAILPVTRSRNVEIPNKPKRRTSTHSKPPHSHQATLNESDYLSLLSGKELYQEMSDFWKKHMLALPGLKGRTTHEVKSWSSELVSTFVKKLTGKEQCGRVFVEEEIDGEAFLLLTQSDISNILKLKLGPSVKIYNAIILIKRTTN